MVEGPGCKVKGEKLKQNVMNTTVLRVKGQATKGDKTGKSLQQNKFEVLVGSKIMDIQTLGKELFIFFEGRQFCLRMHFLMDGGFRLNGKKVDSEMGGEAKNPTLLLFLSSDAQLAFNKSAADIRNAEESLAHIASLRQLDICYERFSQSAAVTRVMELPEKMLCDVLLDQTVLPGVGNIIKNEALFDSGLMPEVRVSALSETLVNHLVKMTRDFSLIFYRCRRDGKPLWPYLKLYNKEKCKQCSGKIIKTKMGDDSARLTWFCTTCQSSDPNKIKIKLPSKNSLLGWIQPKQASPSALSSPLMRETSSDSSWTCSQCTLINISSRHTCEVCLHPNNTEIITSKFPAPQIGIPAQLSLGKSSVENKTCGKSETCLPTLPTLESSNCLSANVSMKRKLRDREVGCETQPIAKVGKFSFRRKSTYAVREAVSAVNASTNSLLSPTNLYLDAEASINTGNDYERKSSDSENATAILQTSKMGERMPLTRHVFDNSIENSYMQSSHNQCIAQKPIQTPENQISQKAIQLSQHMSKPSTDDKSKMMVSRSQPIATKSRQFTPKATTVASQISKPSSTKHAAPVCTQHKVQCRMQRVHKEGANHSRMFWCCPSRKRCSFFQWADENFPICDGHGKRAVLRTVLKLGPNNGRKFFACPLSKTKQCGFFKWVEGMD